MTKFPKFFNFKVFLLFCYVFDRLCELECLKGQQIKVGCPVVFHGEITAMLWIKMSQIDTENDKNLNFQRFFCIFSKFLTDFVDWNVEKGQQGKNVLSSMFSEEIHAVFFIENGLELTSIKTKIRIFSDFHIFLQYFSNYRQTSLSRFLRLLNNEKFCY